MEALAWAIAAYLSNPDADDGDIADLLEHHGVPDALAQRLVVMLPLAFGRRVLHSIVALPDEIRAGGVPLTLSADAVYAAAWARAQDATRAEVDAIGMRSSEVHGVNSALKAGSKAEDLALATALPALPAGPLADPAWATARLAEFTTAHGSKLAWTARVFPSRLTRTNAQYQLDVVVPTPDGRRVVESFAGMGATIADAVAESLNKFARGSLHVLLAALENDSHDDQVDWEVWGEPPDQWRACVGPLLRQWSSKTAVDFAAYLDAVKTALLAAPLSRELHWFRTFVAIGTDGPLLGRDALLDNETWPPGDELLVGWPWPRGEEAYALRHLVALVPHGGVDRLSESHGSPPVPPAG